MLYIHKLADLNPKTAHIESITFLRDFKQRFTFPITDDTLKASLAECWINEADIQAVVDAQNTLPQLQDKLRALSGSVVFEPVNVGRVLGLVSSYPEALESNRKYATEMSQFFVPLVQASVFLVNSIPQLSDPSQKKAVDEQINTLFEKVLRDRNFMFNAAGLVGEGHLVKASDLLDIIPKGYLFHFTLEEEIKKLPFDVIKNRISADYLAQCDSILRDVGTLVKGVKSAYDVNMRMIMLSIVLYSWVRWSLEQK